jgi:ribosomal protein S18 acetylase RimI-like enzyme
MKQAMESNRLLESVEPVTICDANLNDFDAILNVLNVVNYEFVPPLTDGENLRVKVLRILNDRHRGWIKAVSGERVVGVVAVIYNYRRPQLGLIETLAVLPEFRRQGIGKKLVQFAMAKLFRNGMEASLITTWETNITAVTIYKELGFRMMLRKKSDDTHFKLFFLHNLDKSARLQGGFSQF